MLQSLTWKQTPQLFSEMSRAPHGRQVAELEKSLKLEKYKKKIPRVVEQYGV
ncbi:MAG TPA: hypothetical protein VFJ56_06680 [Nitrospira sp.]|nr:hypothetical protein [Nitrospira sp.]